MECLCDCGGIRVTNLRNLIRGFTLSCGCLYKEKIQAGLNVSHGLANHPLYHVWYLMIARCEDPATKNYRNYGGRGIKVCDRWHDLALFIKDVEQELGARPTAVKGKTRRYPAYTLDRINNGRGYEPGNVRWATAAQQAANRGRGEHRNCDRCGATFQMAVQWQRYCSPRCRKEASWARQDRRAKIKRRARAISRMTD